MNLFEITYDEQYELIKLYDILSDMDCELSDLQRNVFDTVLAHEVSNK